MNNLPPKVIIIILNWNRWQDTVECVESVLKATYPNFTVVLVDNGSSDGSATILAQRFPEVELICLTENRYYAGGNNVGLRHALAAGARYVMLLNNDTVVHPDFLNSLVAAMEADNRLVAVGGTIYLYGQGNLIHNAGLYFNLWTGMEHKVGFGERDVNQFSQPRDVDFIGGAAILLRAGALEEIGLLDESFQLYYEETDWCLRAKEKGYKIRFIPQSKVFHKEKVTANAVLPLVMFLSKRNNIWVMRRHANWAQQLCFHLVCLVYRYPKAIFGRIVRKEFNLIFPSLKGIVAGFISVPVKS
jgi:GT2 family glycosyltransferase